MRRKAYVVGGGGSKRSSRTQCVLAKRKCVRWYSKYRQQRSVQRWQIGTRTSKLGKV